MANKNQIKQVMRRLVNECRDPRTGEVNHTLLGERTADELDLYVGDDYEIPQEVFDLACEFD